jgi:hypothetical protein
MGKKRRRLMNYKPGTFLRIPLADGSFGYGRALPIPDMAFYNYRTTEPSEDLDAIAASPVLFSQAVRVFNDSGWDVLGIRPLEGEVARPVVRFMQDLADYRKCRIFDSAGMSRSATPEECIGLERAAIWDDWHIEERLLDIFMGRPNEQEIRNRVRLE